MNTPETQPPPVVTPEVVPPQPKGVAALRVLKTVYRNWIAAGGTPAIYGPTPPYSS
jgi:hypothetical protein